MTHQTHHTPLYKLKRALNIVLVISGAMSIVGAISLSVLTIREKMDKTVDAVDVMSKPMPVTISSTYYFHPSDGVAYKEIKNVGLTYYSRGDGYTPGHTTRSGRFVYDGAIAVSQTMWNKEVFAGDLVWVRATQKWYRVEDTMHEKYKEPRVDIYTHDMDLANSGAHRTDIIIVRQPK